MSASPTRPEDINRELLRRARQAHQIEAPLLTDYEQAFSIRARRRIAEHKRSHSKLRRFGAGLAKPRLAEPGRTLAQGPDILGVIARRLKQKIFTVWRPRSMELLRRLVPPRQDRMQILPVRRNLP